MATTLQTLLSAVSESTAKSVRVCMPGTVEEFDGPSQTCSVQPSLSETATDGSITTLPVVSGVPVMYPGSSTFGMTFPLAKGDNVLLVFADGCIDGWYAGVPNTNPRKHHLSDCYAIPGGRPTASKLSEVKDDAIVVGKQGDVGVRVSGGLVELGIKHSETASEAAVLGDAQKSAIDSLLDSMKSAIDAMLTTGTCAAGPVTFTGTPVFITQWASAKASYDAAQTLSSKVKVK